VFVFISGCIFFNIMMTGYFRHLPRVTAFADIIAQASATTLNLVLIIALSCCYEIVAQKLTNWGKCIGLVLLLKFGSIQMARLNSGGNVYPPHILFFMGHGSTGFCASLFPISFIRYRERIFYPHSLFSILHG